MLLVTQPAATPLWHPLLLPPQPSLLRAALATAPLYSQLLAPISKSRCYQLLQATNSVAREAVTAVKRVNTMGQKQLALQKS